MEEATDRLITWLDTFEKALRNKSARHFNDLQIVLQSTSPDALFRFLSTQDNASPSLGLKAGLGNIVKLFEQVIRSYRNVSGEQSAGRLDSLFGIIQCTLMIGHNVYRDIKTIGRQLEVINSMCHPAESMNLDSTASFFFRITSEIVEFCAVVVAEGMMFNNGYVAVSK